MPTTCFSFELKIITLRFTASNFTHTEVKDFHLICQANKQGRNFLGSILRPAGQDPDFYISNALTGV